MEHTSDNEEAGYIASDADKSIGENDEMQDNELQCNDISDMEESNNAHEEQLSHDSQEEGNTEIMNNNSKGRRDRCFRQYMGQSFLTC